MLCFDLFYRICICCHDRNSRLMWHCEYMGPTVRCSIEHGLAWPRSISQHPDCFGGGPPAAKCLGGDQQMISDGHCVSARTDLQDPFKDDEDEDRKNAREVESSEISEVSECLLCIYFLLHCSINNGAHRESTGLEAVCLESQWPSHLLSVTMKRSRR